MSLSASRVSVSHKRTVSSLLAGRVLKRPRQEDGRRLQEAAVQLLEQHQNLSCLFREAGNPDVSNIFQPQKSEEQKCSAGVSSGVSGSMLACELRRQASQLEIPVTVLSGKMVLQRLKEVAVETEGDRKMLTSSQRAQLSGVMEASRELLSHAAFCPKLLWQEFKRDQKLPSLEVVYYLHHYSILTLKNLIESDGGVRSWLVPQLKALCGWRPPQEDEDTRHVQQRVLNTVVGMLVGTGFDLDSAADRKLSLLCCSMLDDMLFWVLDVVDTAQSAATGAKLWIQMFDASLCGVSASAEALQRFFKHSLTQVLTYKPRLTVSDAITLQNEWTFAKVDRLLTLLFQKLAVIFRVEQLLAHLQQVLETHEVNWKHVLCLLSTLLVYSQSGQPSLKDLLTRLLRSAFEGYDLENLITAFLLARQGALEGPCIFSSYSDWFKMSFGGGSGFHANSKKSLVFLLKFLSDLVPFEPPQYLKVHILHPPYVPVKHRSLLMEYVSLAKTRLSDLKESVEEMGLYEDVSGASVQPQCQAAQDVEKAVCLFESTGRISATVMEASIFRRPYFLTRFLPALLKPRVLPVKPDDRMSFIEALRKADKIPSVQYSSYVESCQKLMQNNKKDVSLDTNDDPLEVLKIQLQEFTELVVDGNDGEMSAQTSRISHTLSVVFPGSPDDLIGQKSVITLDSDAPLFPELHVKVVNMILRNFCQCLLNASRSNPPNRQPPWASRFVGMLLGNKQLLSGLIRRLWDLFHNQGRSLSAAHVLGLAAFLVHLHASSSQSPLVQLRPPGRPQPPGEALGSALPCNTSTNMLFTVRLCVAAACYGICVGESLPQQQQQEFIPCSLYKKLLYLIPRLVPEARRAAAAGSTAEHPEGKLADLWSSVTDSATTWRKTAGQLWRHDAFQQLEQTPQFQLCFSEWLKNELRVRREEDALSDAQRQEYQQWVCSELYLTRPEDRGGCGGDMTTLCSQLLGAVMDQQSSDVTREEISCGTGAAGSGTCLPDVLSRLQELVYEMEATNLPGGGGHGRHLCDFLFDLASQRCCVATATSPPPSVGAELGLQRNVLAWNRVLLSLPAVSLIKVKPEGGRMTLDCNKLIEHVNQHQRKACSPAGLLSFHITAHFLKGLVCASVRCGRPGEEVNVVWSQMSVRCPLLLVSTARCWQLLSPLLASLWRRLQDGDSPPEQLQLLTDCQLWACSLERGRALPTPPAAALLLAASLHAAWRGCQGNQQSFGAALKSLRPEKDAKHRQVLVFLLFLCVNDFLSALLYPQEKSRGEAGAFCSELLTALASSPDWLLIFKPDEPSAYQSATMVTSDECKRLLPFAFCSLIPQQSAELLQTLAGAPGFLHAAVVCYGSVLQLFLDGRIPPPAAERSEEQPTAEPSQILSHTKRFLLSLISQTSPAALSSSQFRQLESLCADLDPELAAALSVNLDPHSLSPEMDFL